MNTSTTDPLVTIVIPAYNHEGYVKDAIKSVLAQVYKNWELIIINDGSTDKTGQVCDQFAHHEGVQVIHQENMGLSATLNKALEMARGDYFGFLPSDDMFYPEKLLIQVDFLDTHRNLAGVGGLQTLVDAHGNPIEDKAMEEWFSYIPSSRPDFLLKLLERNFVPAPSMLLRTEIVREKGGFDTSCRYMQDYDLWFRILKTHDMKILPRPLIYYRWHGENLTYTATEETEEERGRVFEKAAKLLEITDLYPELWEEFRPEVIALCRTDLHERLSVNPTPNFEEIHGIFDEKFVSLWRKRKKLDIPAQTLKRVAPPYSANFSMPGVILEVSSLDKGGLEQVVHDLALGLSAQKVPVTVVCVREGGFIADKLRDKGIRVEVLPLNDKTQAYETIIRESGARLINSHYSNFGARLALRSAIPFVATVHNIYAWLPSFSKEGIRETDPLVCHYVAVSKDVKEFMTLKFGISEDKISVIENGLDLAFWSEKERLYKGSRKDLGLHERDFVFLATAALSRVKGQDRIIRAMAKVRSQCKNARAVLVGPEVDRPFCAYLRELVEQLELKDNVIIHPFDKDPARWYFHADAFVLPSLIEGWSISMLEAMYAELPVIMTDVAGARTAISEAGCGITVPAPFRKLSDLDTDFLERYTMIQQDPVVDPLAKAMLEVCQNPEKWKQAGKQGRKIVSERYNLKTQVNGYLELFQRIMIDFSGRFVEYFNQRLNDTQKALELSQRSLEKTYESQRQGFWLQTLNQQLTEAWQRLSEEMAEKERIKGELSGEISRLKAELEGIYNSRGWKLIESGRRLKRTLKREG